MAWIDLTSELTKEGIKNLKVTDVLFFDYEGSKTYIKIMRKSKGKVWGKELDSDKFLTPEQADEQVWVTND